MRRLPNSEDRAQVDPDHAGRFSYTPAICHDRRRRPDFLGRPLFDSATGRKTSHKPQSVTQIDVVH
jgi:hypothetical protein